MSTIRRLGFALKGEYEFRAIIQNVHERHIESFTRETKQ
jgi:hypothetical protein